MRFYLNVLEERTKNKSCLTEDLWTCSVSIYSPAVQTQRRIKQNLEEWLQACDSL